MISARAINDVLAGRHGYDSLKAEEQAVVRAVWTERLGAIAGGINLANRFVARGRRTWVDMGHEGSVVWHGLGVETQARSRES